jgi:Domain of unknown function, E. rectale Gene description (DUF3877)
MREQLESSLQALQNNIIDVIKEEQIKIGYKSETIRLYYPLESVCNLLGASYTIKELQVVLEKFCQYAKALLGDVKFSNKDTRFCFVIPPSGVNYVHEMVEENYFLREFIEKVSLHNATLEEILNIFYKYSDNVICDEMDNGEFDYLIYFKEEKPDSYRYCLKFEDCHTIYHRFTKADYENFDF